MQLDLNKYLNIHSPGYVIDIYKDNNIEELVIGNKCILPSIEPTTSNTLYDIASLTKTYTATLIYIAYEEGLLDINDTVYNLDNNFINLKDVKIVDLLAHHQEIWTDGYLGSATTKEEFYKILHTAYVKEKELTYVDSHYIILSTILEKIYKKSYKELIEEKIINKLNLKNTTFDPDSNITASNNYEHNEDTIIDTITPGIIHDTKGRIAKSLGIYTGHASIFTTGHDLITFLKSFFDYTLLKEETVKIMLSHLDANKINKEYLNKYVSDNDINIMYEEYLKTNPKKIFLYPFNNMGARYKNDIRKLNDVPDICSNNTISFSGFTGPMYTIDFDNKIIVVIMCNVMHNTTLSRQERKNKTIEIMDTIFNKLLK